MRPDLPRERDTAWRTDLPWADLVVDLRHGDAHDPLFVRLMDPIEDRAVTVDGWRFTPYAMPGGFVGGSTSILLGTAPDGWRVGFALTQTSGRGFAYGAVRRGLPVLGRMLAQKSTSPQTRAYLAAHQAAALPLFRSALEHPTGWDPGFDPGEDPSWLIEHASVGVPDAEIALALSSHEINVVNSYTQPRSDLLTWRDAGFPDRETAGWLAAGVAKVTQAGRLVASGFTAEAYLDWESTEVPPSRSPARARRLREAGWTAAGLRALEDAVPVRDPRPLFDAVRDWTLRLGAARASAYLQAGVCRVEEAVAIERGGQPPTAQTLAALAAMRPPALGGVPEHLLGDPRILDDKTFWEKAATPVEV